MHFTISDDYIYSINEETKVLSLYNLEQEDNETCIYLEGTIVDIFYQIIEGKKATETIASTLNKDDLENFEAFIRKMVELGIFIKP